VQLFVDVAVLVDQLRDLHVVAAILSNFQHLPLPEPFNCLQAFGGFLDSQGGGGD